MAKYTDEQTVLAIRCIKPGHDFWMEPTGPYQFRVSVFPHCCLDTPWYRNYWSDQIQKAADPDYRDKLELVSLKIAVIESVFSIKND